MDKLAIIEQCIQNDKMAIVELNYHLNKLYEMRSNELEENGIDPLDWEASVEQFLKRDLPL